ncbi:autotransporter-associated beta strand repeat-containing protein [Xanthomonas oryzae]|uniref:Autotransporter domain-containing protein n=1 Tax=Xanthomonas oryzae pv. oryzae TaxID=64187 RepID=A0AAJ5SNW1_XANOO|nr:autotransporter-associated beta strand repeat-containing protein [Xanthomonas oryzae]OLI96098.1 outer membrane protein [Xanthomonas oryzae pv. oryzae]QIE19973.1 hypothetical protein IXO704_012850 [Xanthomonas oryzae pv. oryzae]UXV79072.1 hypothetical protein IXO842_012025 [Xanthomonas oryzae pv. oryzae]UXW01692.1 hypothetical protein IXO792_12260 [Xanthomonas oryzae pv. oryzae]UXW14795.1 autotransporter-associated beta strand repeat-containing protein [Xanthomonas oryzae pv. oryzae]
MNRAFALVWNAAIGNWVVTHELVRRRRKPGAPRRQLPALVVLTVGAAAPMLAWGACTPAIPAAGATVTCSGLPITSNIFASGANNLTVNIASGSQMTAGLLGGTAIALSGTNSTLNNAGTIDPSVLGLLSVLSSGVTMGNASSTAVSVNNLAGGTIYGTGGVLGANLLNLDGMALRLTSASGGTVQINNAGVIDSRPLAGLSILSSDTPVIAVTGGGTVNAVNTGTINGRVGFQSSATGNTFVNAGAINGSVSMGAGSTNSFTAVTTGTVNSAGGLALELLGPGGLLSFAQTGVVDGGLGGNNTLILQNSAVGTGSGSTGAGTLSTAQYINFGNLRVNSGTWSVGGANNFGNSALNGGVLQFANPAQLGNTITANGGTLEATAAGLTLAPTNGIALGAGGLSLQGTNNLIIGSAITGTGALTKTGTGELTLNGAGTFTGGVNLIDGALTVGTNSALGTGNVTASGGSVLAGASVNLANAFSLSNTVGIGGENPLRIAGTISGTGLLNKVGTGTLTLGGNNTYSGGTTLGAGSVLLETSGALGTGTVTAAGGSLDTTAPLSLTNNFALTNTLGLGASGNALTLSGTLAGVGGVNKTGAGTLTLGGLNTYSGGTNLASGTLQLGTASALGTGALNVTGASNLSTTAPLTVANDISLAAALNLPSTQALTLTGAISGAGSLIKNGTTTLSLTATNSYSGGTSLTAGTIAVGADNALGTGTLAVLGNSVLSNAVAVALANDIALGAALTVDNAADMLASGAISGSGDLIKTGLGTLTLSGNNSYTGPLAIQAGTVVASTAASLGNASNVDVAAGALLNLTNGGLINTLTGAGDVDTDTGATLQLGGGDFAGSVGGGGNLDKVGTGTVRLLGTSAIGGSTQVSGGTLDVVGSLGTSALNVALGGTLTGTAGNVRAAVNISDGGRLALTSGSSLSVGALTLAPGAFVDVALGAPSTTRLLEVNGNLTLDGTLNITDIGGFGTGVYRLIDYTGALTNNGMLIGLFPGSVDISQLALQTAIGQQLNLVVTAPGSIVQFWDGVQTTANGTIDGGNGTWGAATNWTGQDGSANSAWQGDFAVFSGAAGTVGVQGTQNIGGLQFVTDGYQLTDVGAGALAVTNPLTAIRVDPGATASIGVAITGIGGVEKLDTGTLVLSGPNTYTGGTALSGGSLVLGNAQALGTGTLTAAAGTTLDTNQALAVGNAVVLNGALTVPGSNDLALTGAISGPGSLIKNGTSTLALDGSNSYLGGSVLNAGTLAVGSNTALGAGALSVLGTSTLSNAIALALGNNVNLGANLTIASADNLALTGVLSGAGALTKTGLGTLTLSGSNLFSGPVSVQSGVLATSSTGTLGTTASVDVAAGAGLSLGSNTALNSLAGLGNVAIVGSNTLQLGVNNASSTFAGSLSDAGNLEKVGTGTLQLTGTSAIGGTTQITAGTLDVDGTLGSTGGLTVGTGGTLSGSGVVDAAVTVNDGGRLVVTSGSLLTTGSLSFAPNATLDAFLGIPSQTGVLAVNGDLTLDGTLNITDIGGFGTGVYRLIDYTGVLTNNGMGFGTLPGTVDSTQLTLQTSLAQQVNVVLLESGNTAQFWDGAQTVANGIADGGTGVWTAGATNWTSGDGLTNSDWQNSFAVFGGTAGNVGVQGTQGIVGMQFITDGYVLSDAGAGALSANAANTIIRVDPGVTGTIDVAIGGTGALQKLDTGTLVLSGSNTYTGGTALGGGSLVLGNAQALGTGTLTTAAGTTLDTNQALTVGNTVVLDGALTLPGSNDLALTGAISGAGSLIKNGTSTLTLSGNNSYAGGTVLNDGTLAVAGDTALGSGTLSVNGDSVLSNPVAAALGNAVTLGAALTVDNPADLTLAGNISGSGALIKTNTGTLTLGGSNTYSGGTTLTAGTLVGDSASLQGAIVDNATLAFNQVADGVFNGSITGTGTVVKDGVGALLLNGANGYTGGTSIVAGTLIGDTASLQGDIANDAALVFNQTTDGVYAGTVSGTGSLEKAGAGALQLLGPNTYTGGTVISAGSLVGNTASLQGDVVDNATLIFDQASDDTFAGTVSGTGSVIKQGTGALTLVAPNTYSGGTTVASGSLIGTTASLQGDIVNNAVLVFDQAGDGTYAGNVSGSGALIKQGAGALTLQGGNSYLGGTTINAGTLIGNTASLQGDITNNSTLTFLQNSAGTYSGRLFGFGRFIKLGNGTLVLTANSGSFTGPTEVNAGTLSLGNQANPGAALGGPVTVGPGGTLTGSGSIGSLVSSGTVVIGGTSGTISVGGNATFAPGSTLQVAPGAGGVVTPVTVGGAATVATGTTLELVRATDLPLFTEIPVISASGGLTGQFTNIISDYAFIDPNVSLTATALSVTFGRNTVGMVGMVTTPNQQSTAAAVDGLPNTSPIYQAVLRLPDDPEAVRTAFASLSGESHASTATALLDSRFLNSGIGNHLRGDSQDTLVGDTMVWITGRSLPNRVDGNADAVSVRREDNGVMAGAERRFGESSVVGIAVGNQDIKSWSREWGDRADVDGTHAGVYGRTDWSAFSLQGVVDYASYNIDSTRRLMLPGVLAERLSSSYDATAVTVSLEAAWNLRTKGAVYSPFVAADYTRLKTDGFTERGGISALSVDRASDTFSTATLGVRGHWDLGQKAGLYASAGWRHAFGDRSVQRSAGFVGTASEFSVQSVTLAKNAVVGELGVSLITSPGSRLALSLQGLDGDGQTAYGGQVTWAVSF